MTDKRHRERMTMPGHGPTNEDVRLDRDLTRQELSDTVSELATKTRRATARLASLTVVLVLIVLWRRWARR